MKRRATTQQLEADLKLLIHDAEDLLAATAGAAGERVKAIRSRLSAALESAKATCKEVQAQAIETAETTDQIIRRHPYETLGVAFGAGLVIGVLVACR